MSTVFFFHVISAVNAKNCCAVFVTSMYIDYHRIDFNVVGNTYFVIFI